MNIIGRTWCTAGLMAPSLSSGRSGSSSSVTRTWFLNRGISDPQGRLLRVLAHHLGRALVGVDQRQAVFVAPENKRRVLKPEAFSFLSPGGAVSWLRGAKNPQPLADDEISKREKWKGTSKNQKKMVLRKNRPIQTRKDHKVEKVRGSETFWLIFTSIKIFSDALVKNEITPALT